MALAIFGSIYAETQVRLGTMETVISAPASGTITLLVKQGDQVQTGHPLAEIK